jgi:hypothetical protein
LMGAGSGPVGPGSLAAVKDSLTYPNAARICDYLLGGAGVGDGGLVEGCHDLHGPAERRWSRSLRAA